MKFQTSLTKEEDSDSDLNLSDSTESNDLGQNDSLEIK